MTVHLMIRRQATMAETKESLNARLLECFVRLPGFWASGKTAADAVLGTGEESATLILAAPPHRRPRRAGDLHAPLPGLAVAGQGEVRRLPAPRP